MKNDRNKIFGLAVFVLCITMFGLVSVASAGTSLTICLIDGSDLSGSSSPVKALLRIPTEDVPDFCNGDLYIGITNFSFNGPNPGFIYVKIVQTNISDEPGDSLALTGTGLQIKMGSGLKLDDPSDGYRQVNDDGPVGGLGDSAAINSANDTLKLVINESAWVRAGINISGSDPGDIVIQINLNRIVVESVYSPQDIMLVEDPIQVVEEWIQDLPEDNFKINSDPRKNALSEKLANVSELIVAGEYQEAIDKLQHDIRAKADGSADGNPKDDWITHPDAQREICTMIDDLIAYLETLL